LKFKLLFIHNYKIMRKKIKWKTDLEKDVLIDNFEKRNW